MPLSEAEELELLELEYEQSQQKKDKYPSAVAIPEGANTADFFQSTEQEPEQKSSYQLPHPTQTISRESGRAGLPIAGAMLGAATGGPGLVVPSLMAGIGGAAGKAGEQKLTSGQVDLDDVTKEGALTATGTLAGGLIFKSLASAAEKIFRPSPLDKVTERAAKYAEKNNLPFPLQEGGGALARKGANVSLLPGRLQTQKDAAKVTQFINKMALDDIPKLAPNAKPVGQVVQKGKAFFQNIYNPAKEAGQEGFDKFITAVGPDTQVAVTNLAQGVDDAIEALAKRGFVSTTAKGVQKSTDKLGKYLINLKSNPKQVRTLEDVEVVRKTISKLGSRSEVKTISDSLKEMILRDYDELGSKIGVSARELAADAIQKSARFFKLKKDFPELEFFAKDFADDKWINLLFQGRNAQALTKIRQDSPELYKELSDTWLTTIINKNTRATDGVVGKVLDGPALRKWYEQNAKDLRAVLGKQKAQVLDNFSRYAAHTSEFAAKAKRDEMGAFEMGARAGAELTGIVTQPHVMIPGEATAYVLAKGLSDPSSKLFKLFTSGPSKGFKTTTKGGLMLGGQLAFDGSESP